MQQLQNLRRRLTPHGAWCPRSWALDDTNRPVPPESLTASCWSLLGALQVDCSGADREFLVYLLCKAAGIPTGLCALRDWERTPRLSQEQVLGVIDAALKLSKE